MKEFDAFVSRIEFDDSGCWLWRPPLDAAGYGRFARGGRTYAHRWSFRFFKGDIPDGTEIDHLCRARNCVNPDHLDAVPHSENVRRGNAGATQRARTHCPVGHAYTPENTYALRGGKRGDSPLYTRRTCLTCKRAKALKTQEEARTRTAAEGRAYRGAATHCKYGHPFEGHNLRVAPTGYAVCRECLHRRQRAYHAKKKASAA